MLRYTKILAEDCLKVNSFKDHLDKNDTKQICIDCPFDNIYIIAWNTKGMQYVYPFMKN